MAKDQRHLRFHGGNWWLHYRIPQRYAQLPDCVDYKGILPKNFHTDSLREAKRLRDQFLRRLDAQADDHYATWHRHKPEAPTPLIHPARVLKNPLSIIPKAINPNVERVNAILARGSMLLGENPQPKKLEAIANREREAAYALFNSKRNTGRSLKQLTKLVVRESETQGKAKKTIYKIKRGSSWFIDNILQSDIDIDQIQFDQVRELIIDELIAGVAGSTLKGHLYGLRQIWKRAKQSGLVSGDCPFVDHSIPINSKSYDPFSYEEIYGLFEMADGELKLLIHAGATTGARINELLTAEVKTPSTFEHPCWFLKFRQKGKTAQSTRVVPIHWSLDVEDGFQFQLKYRTALEQMRKLQLQVLGTPKNELNGELRKLSFHSLRSTVITELVVKHSINDKVVGGVTGHHGGGNSKSGSLRGYINADDLHEKKKVVDLLPWKST